VRPALSQRLLAEFLGTALIVTGVIGAGHMVQDLGASPALGLLMIGLSVGFIIVLAISMLAPISGAHFNPAVTLAMLLRKDIPPGHAGLYVATQFVGGAIGALVGNVMFSAPAWSISQVDRSGMGIWLGEALATGGLVLIVLVLVDGDRAAWIPASVGMWVAAGHIFTSSTSFANPAVTFGRILSGAITGIAPESALYFIIFQLLGALAALGVATVLKPTLSAATR
jgi:glycerol uptake facilitator-like aquaporin